MKKIIIMLLCLVPVFCFEACSEIANENPKQIESSTEGAGSEAKDENDVADETSETKDENNAAGNGQAIKIDADTINDSHYFSEGLAFVHLKNDITKTYCINKNGEINFTLGGYYYDITGFHNGLAVLEDLQYNTLFLCDTSGKLIMAEDLGATAIWKDKLYAMFIDGYIPIIRTSDSTNALSIIDSNFSTLVDFSQELYVFFKNKLPYYEYYGGYLYHFGYDSYLDLRTGAEHEGLANMYAELKPKYESDMWQQHRKEYLYDVRYKNDGKENIVLDLTKYKDTLYNSSGFENGLASIMFRTKDPDVGYKTYFTILREDGTFCFEPIELFEGEAYNLTLRSGDSFLVNITSYDHSSVRFITFDKNGKIAESDQLIGAYNYFSDDVLITEGNHYYSLNLEPLF